MCLYFVCLGTVPVRWSTDVTWRRRNRLSRVGRVSRQFTGRGRLWTLRLPLPLLMGTPYRFWLFDTGDVICLRSVGRPSWLVELPGGSSRPHRPVVYDLQGSKPLNFCPRSVFFRLFDPCRALVYRPLRYGDFFECLRLSVVTGYMLGYLQTVFSVPVHRVIVLGQTRWWLDVPGVPKDPLRFSCVVLGRDVRPFYVVQYHLRPTDHQTFPSAPDPSVFRFVLGHLVLATFMTSFFTVRCPV